VLHIVTVLLSKLFKDSQVTLNNAMLNVNVLFERLGAILM